MHKSSLTKNSLFLYLRLFFTLLVSLYSSRLLLDILGIEDFGIYNVVAGFIGLTYFFRNSLVDATQRYLSIKLGENDIVGYNKVFNMCINLHILLSLLLLLLFFTIGLWFVENKLIYPMEREGAVLFVYIATVFSFLIGTIASPYLAVLVSCELMDIYAYLSILNVSLKLGAILLLNVMDEYVDKLILYAVFLLCIALVDLLMQYLYVQRKIPFVRYEYCWNRSLFLSIISFTSWNTIGSCAILLISQGGNILLNLFFGPIVNAANGIAYQVMGAIRQFSSSFQSAINPRITKLYAKKEYSEMINLCITGSKISYFLFLMIGLPLCYRISYVLDLWLVDVPDYTSVFCVLVIITASIEALGYPIITVIRAIGKLKGYQLWVSLVLLLSLPISYILFVEGCLPYWVYIINAICTLVASFTRVMYLRKYLAFDLLSFLGRLFVPIIIVSCILVSGNYFIFSFIGDGFCFFIFQCMISVFMSLTLIFFLGLEKNEKKYVASVLSKMKGRIWKRNAY